MDKGSTDRKIAVYDLGGGTFDISILELGDGVFEVLSTNGDTHLGGDDFDQVIIDFLADEFKRSEDIDLKSDPWLFSALRKLQKKPRLNSLLRLKRRLTTIYFSHIQWTKTPSKDFNSLKFEQLSDNLVKRSMQPVQKALDDAGLSTNDINEDYFGGRFNKNTNYPK